MPDDPSHILQHVAQTEGTLAFCDETDITQQATSTMLPNIHLCAALIMPSSAYAAVVGELDHYRQANALPEFHATEIVSPHSKSPWRDLALPDRRSALQFACGLVTHPACSIRYVHVPLQQYEAMRAEHPKGAMPKNQKSAVKKVFLSCLAEHLSVAAPAVVIMDRVKPNAQPTIAKLPNASHLIGGGAIYADSAAVAGLQLADVAAYAVGRFIRRRDTIIAGAEDAFDELIMTTVAALDGRFKSLL